MRSITNSFLLACLTRNHFQSAFGGDEAVPAPFRRFLNSSSANRDPARKTPHEIYCALPPIYGFIPGVETGGVVIFLPEAAQVWHIAASK